MHTYVMARPNLIYMYDQFCPYLFSLVPQGGQINVRLEETENNRTCSKEEN